MCSSDLMSSAATARYSKGKATGSRFFRIQPIASSSAARPAARGSSYSISSKRIVRSEGKIAGAGPRRRPSKRVFIIRRWRVGVRTGSFAPISSRRRKAVSSISVVEAGGATESHGVSVFRITSAADRKRIGKGKTVLDRVEHGGGSLHKKK